jgi:hypothetical protein
VGSFCIRPVYMGCAPCAFNNIDFLPIKIFFGKNKNKENIDNNIGGAPLDHKFTRSQTMKVQKEKLTRFLLIVNFILGFLFNFIMTLFSFPYRIRFTIATRILFTFLLGFCSHFQCML